jgi:hypothetical protein
MEAGVKINQTMYELALAIGGSLNMQSVLHKALDAFVRGLGCASGAVYLASPDVLPDEPALAIPDARAANGAVQIAGTLLAGLLTRNQWRAFCDTLPKAGAHHEHGVYYLLPIGRQGLLVLAGCTALLDRELAAALLSLMVKLDEATRLCLQHEELAAAHRTAVLEGSILRTVFDATPAVLPAVDKKFDLPLWRSEGAKDGQYGE